MSLEPKGLKHVLCANAQLYDMIFILPVRSLKPTPSETSLSQENTTLCVL